MARPAWRRDGRNSPTRSSLRSANPSHLDLISTAEWLKDREPKLYNQTDVEAGFDPSTAVWLRSRLGFPAMAVSQPHFLDYGQARHIGMVAHVCDTRGIDIVEAPPELGWISPKRQLLMWIPASNDELCH